MVLGGLENFRHRHGRDRRGLLEQELGVGEQRRQAENARLRQHSAAQRLPVRQAGGQPRFDLRLGHGVDAGA